MTDQVFSPELLKQLTPRPIATLDRVWQPRSVAVGPVPVRVVDSYQPHQILLLNSSSSYIGGTPSLSGDWAQGLAIAGNGNLHFTPLDTGNYESLHVYLQITGNGTWDFFQETEIPSTLAPGNFTDVQPLWAAVAPGGLTVYRYAFIDRFGTGIRSSLRWVMTAVGVVDMLFCYALKIFTGGSALGTSASIFLSGSPDVNVNSFPLPAGYLLPLSISNGTQIWAMSLSATVINIIEF